MKLPAAIQTLAYADGALWAAVGEAGVAVRIDPTTYCPADRTGSATTSRPVDVHDGLVAVGRAAELAGHHVRARGPSRPHRGEGQRAHWSGAPPDPALYSALGRAAAAVPLRDLCEALQLPDVEGERGRTVVPEVAARLPRVSDGGRTYTIRIREGSGSRRRRTSR